MLRCSRLRSSIMKGVLKSFAKFIGQHLRQGLSFNKVAGLRPAALLKKRFWRRCFPVKFTKFLRKPFLHSTSGQLFLYAPANLQYGSRGLMIK